MYAYRLLAIVSSFDKRKVTLATALVDLFRTHGSGLFIGRNAMVEGDEIVAIVPDEAAHRGLGSSRRGVVRGKHFARVAGLVRRRDSRC
jgi:hypothetical protein